jgi:hypothetical protein
MISVSSIASEQKSEQLLLMAQADTQEAKTSEQQPKSSRKWISNGESLGKWWKKRALKLDRLPPEWLYHLEGEYSFNENTGNWKQTDHKAKIALTLRKGLVTSEASFELRDQEQGEGSHLRTQNKKVFNVFAYGEFWKRVDLSGGLQWYTYDKRFIEDRYTAFGGLYFTLLDLPNYVLKFGAFYGYATISYMNDKIAQLNPGLEFPDYSSDVLYLQQRFTWSISDKLTFKQKGSYRQYIEDSNFIHWILNFDLDYKLTKHFSIFGTYKVDYESTELNQQLRGLEKKDTDLYLGIRINF